MSNLARILSRFYRNAPTNAEIKTFGSWPTIKKNCEENFSQTEEFAGEYIDQRMYQIIRSATRHFLQRRKALFDMRVEADKICEGHGDMRTGHIYYTEEGVQIIDCIEFNQRFRCSDTASDLAFLAEEALCLRHQVELYMELAYKYAKLFSRPIIWVVCGMIASGKSTVARALADALQTKTLRSDVIRKELFAQQALQYEDVDFEEGMYSGDATSLTYGKLLLEAQDEIEGGNSIILDATFSREYQRRDVWRLAADMDANIVFIECRCGEDVIRRRLAERALDGGVSDARLKHLDAFKNRYEAIDEHYNSLLLHVDTEKPLKQNMAHILSQAA